MTLKLGTLLLLSASAAAMSAQTPVAGDIYSQTGSADLNGKVVVYNFANWHAGEMEGDVSLWSALFDELMDIEIINDGVNGVIADMDGISVSWNSVDKQFIVDCAADKLGRTQVLVADINGMNRGMVTVDETPAQISLSNYVNGTYVVAVAVDGKLVKTFKIILK